ncbi:MAG: thiamine phosphate synthase [Acidobacteria bacterium]|nr:thiamine phosphate synthase [Acidobacteriota bacterium]
MRPVSCLITPKIQGDGDAAILLDRIGAAARAGVNLIQIRQPEMDGGPLQTLVEHALARVKGTGARILVNDRVDVALCAGAHGVHLRGNSMAACRVRAIAPRGFIIGRSVHSAEEAQQAMADGGLDFLVFGTVFETMSKPGAVYAGATKLAETCAAVPLPVLAVGGMTIPVLREVAAAGAAGFAAIGLFSDPPIEGLSALVQEANASFGAGG